MEDWAEIRRLYLAERMRIKAIAKKLHLSRNTVRNAVRSAQPPRYVRAGSGSIVVVVAEQDTLLRQPMVAVSMGGNAPDGEV